MKISEIWEAIEDQRPKDIKIIDWRQSYDAVKSAIEYVGYEMITSKEEFIDIPIPIDRRGCKCYINRKIIIKRDGIQSILTRIDQILTKTSLFKTSDEMKIVQKKINDDKMLNQPKGVSTTTDKEMNAIDKLDELLGIEKYLDKQHLIEFRIADVAYRFKNGSDIEYVADQVKTSYAKSKNITFSVTIKDMITILEKNMSLTCIAMNDDIVDVIWFFYGTAAIDILNNFEKNKKFKPTRHLTKKSNRPFTMAINDAMFRYDVGTSKIEIERLLQQKLEFVKIGVKQSIKYLNEDDTQIMSSSHRLEQQSFAMTRDACSKIDIKVARHHEDNYSCVDFRIKDKIKIQDKSYTTGFHMRRIGSLPYDPDKIDILQISNLVTKEIYAIPMRIISNNIVKSMFSEDILMKESIFISLEFKTKYTKYKYDLKKEQDIHSYVVACEAAAMIPELTDHEFYKNMLDANKDKFGSLKQIKELKLTV